MKEHTLFSEYLSQTQKLTIALDRGEHPLHDLLDWVDQQMPLFPSMPAYQHFFKAEKAFYKGMYEQALKSYLLAREIPEFPFFCYRASAYVSHKMGQKAKALQFTQKALTIRPNDYVTLKMLQQLNRNESSNTSASVETETPPPFDDRELEELNHIFQSTSEPTEALFSAETSAVVPPLEFLPPKTAPAQIQRVIEKEHTEMVEEYRLRIQSRAYTLDHFCMVLQNWNLWSRNEIPLLATSEAVRAFRSGVFLKWKGMGIAINPGRGFLEQLHIHGLFVTDIDIVIVTRNEPEAYTDLTALYHLNYQLNKDAKELHVLQCYLTQHVYQRTHRELRPNFKQEKGTLHTLDLFSDAPHGEKAILAAGIQLHYFALGSEHLGCVLELSEHEHQCKIGLLPDAPWDPQAVDPFAACDVLIGSIGKTNGDDFNFRRAPSTHLGLSGLKQAAQLTKPKLLIACELDGSYGDIRYDALRKLRHEVNGSILPGESGLCVDLYTLAVKPPDLDRFYPVHEIKLLNGAEPFAPLRFTTSDQIL